MDFGLSEVHTQIQSTIRTFVKRECPRETAHALDETGTPPTELLSKIAELGFCGLNVPETHGGAGSDVLGAALVTEALASASPPLAALYAGATLCGGSALSRLASPEQQESLLPRLADGGLSVALIPADNPLGPAAATRAATGFTLSGQAPCVQPFLSGGLMILQAGHENQTTWFLVRSDSPGVQVAPHEAVGMRGTGAVSVVLENVQVVDEDALGGPAALNQGAAQSSTLVALSRLAAAATALGLAQGALDYASAYAQERQQFGRTIAQFEAVLHMLVDLTVDASAARWLLYHACWLADQDQPFELEAGMAALKTADVARRAGLQGVHILGGYGYMAEYDAARYLRDAMVAFDGGEPSQLLKTAIGDMAGLRTQPE
jgi:hypothetical protein